MSFNFSSSIRKFSLVINWKMNVEWISQDLYIYICENIWIWNNWESRLLIGATLRESSFRIIILFKMNSKHGNWFRKFSNRTCRHERELDYWTLDWVEEEWRPQHLHVELWPKLRDLAPSVSEPIERMLPDDVPSELSSDLYCSPVNIKRNFNYYQK